MIIAGKSEASHLILWDFRLSGVLDYIIIFNKAKTRAKVEADMFAFTMTYMQGKERCVSVLRGILTSYDFSF
jgi:hypothetical protein